jgi:hypothetical protein
MPPVQAGVWSDALGNYCPDLLWRLLMLFFDPVIGVFALDVILWNGQLWWFFTKLALIWIVGIFPCIGFIVIGATGFDLAAIGVGLVFCFAGPLAVLVDWFLYGATCIPYNHKGNIFEITDAEAAEILGEDEEPEAEEF